MLTKNPLNTEASLNKIIKWLKNTKINNQSLRTDII